MVADVHAGVGVVVGEHTVEGHTNRLLQPAPTRPIATPASPARTPLAWTREIECGATAGVANLQHLVKCAHRHPRPRFTQSNSTRRHTAQGAVVSTKTRGRAGGARSPLANGGDGRGHGSRPHPLPTAPTTRNPNLRPQPGPSGRASTSATAVGGPGLVRSRWIAERTRSKASKELASLIEAQRPCLGWPASKLRVGGVQRVRAGGRRQEAGGCGWRSDL